MRTRRSIAALALTGLFWLAAPSLAQDEAQPPDIEPGARAAHDAVRARCPAISFDRPCDASGGGGLMTEGRQQGDRVTLVRECGFEGHGGAADSTETTVVDLATCRAATGIQTTRSGSLDGTYDVVAHTQPPLQGAPNPPGALFREDDPRTAVIRLALTADQAPAPTERGGAALRVFPLVTPEAAGRPAATPATHLTATELRAIGATPRPPRTEINGMRRLRAYRVLAPIPAPTELRPGDHALYGIAAGRCLAVWHGAADRHRWVHCFRNRGAIRWLATEGTIVLGTFTEAVSDYADQESDGEGQVILERLAFAIDLTTGRFASIEPAGLGRCAGELSASVREGHLSVTWCGRSGTIAVSELASALSAP